MFGKLFHVNETTIEKNMDLKSLFFSGSIFRASSLEAELKKGITYKFEKVLNMIFICIQRKLYLILLKIKNKTKVRPICLEAQKIYGYLRPRFGLS